MNYVHQKLKQYLGNLN